MVTPADSSFTVELIGGPPGPTIIEVRSIAFVDGRIVVAASHPDGYWRLTPAGKLGPVRGPYLVAHFVSDPEAAFSYEVVRTGRVNPCAVQS